MKASGEQEKDGRLEKLERCGVGVRGGEGSDRTVGLEAWNAICN